MSEALDLSGANLKGFDLMPSGRQPAVVFECEETETKNEGGKLPLGTKGYKFQFKVDGGEYDNRRLFNNYWLPGEDYEDSSKRATMQGMFVKVLLAIGYGEKEVLGGKFKFDPEDAIGRECIVVVGKQAARDGYEEQNTVRNVLPRSAGETDDSDLL